MDRSKWLQYITPNFKLHQDGFFEFPYLANSPQIMIKSTIKTPTSKHVLEEQAVCINNPFTKGVMRYREIEEGFWIIASNIEFKQNTLIRTIYDESVVNDYYTLTFTFFENQIKLQNTFTDKIPFQSKYWGFKKPGTDAGAYFCKGSKCEFYIYSFSEDWIKWNIPFEKLDKNIPFKMFLDSNKGFITYQDIVPNAEKLSIEIWESLVSFDDNVFSKTVLKSQVLSLVSTFFKNAFADLRKEDYKAKDTIDYRKMDNCERLVSNNLTAPFLGIDAVSRIVNLSPSKLKTDFRLVYGTSLLQYNIDKKMNLAMQLILNTDMQIKNITLEVGYESHSKFSAAFKKKFGKLPSEVRPVYALDKK
jgi:AraC-like DNA-binding protein